MRFEKREQALESEQARLEEALGLQARQEQREKQVKEKAVRKLSTGY